jgi:hypothetical protein
VLFELLLENRVQSPTTCKAMIRLALFAEIERSIFTKQYFDRRIDDIDTLSSEAKALADRRDASGAVVDCQFTTDNARIKLKRLNPQLKEKRGTRSARRISAPKKVADPLQRTRSHDGFPVTDNPPEEQR